MFALKAMDMMEAEVEKSVDSSEDECALSLLILAEHFGHHGAVQKKQVRECNYEDSILICIERIHLYFVMSSSMTWGKPQESYN